MFWIVTALFAGIAAHLATVLYWPSITFDHKLGFLASGHKPNSFFLMAPETPVGLLPTAATQDIIGLCVLNLAKGKVVINAHVPQSFWTFTIYDSAGQQIYTINDVEAGADSFTVELTKAKGVLEQVRGKQDPDDVGKIQNVGWHAEVTGEKALAVLWLPVPDPNQRKTLEDVLNKTICSGG